MNAPQYIMLAMLLVKAGVAIERHNKPKIGSWHCANDFMHIGIVILLLLLGGYFDGR